MDSIVPTNTPPEVKKYFDRKKKLLESTNESTEIIPAETQPALKIENTPSVPIPPIRKNTRGYKLTLKHNLYKVSFEVQDISVADYQLAIKVPKTDFRFEPQPNSRFTLECMGETYNVVYLGGLFDFPSDSSWSITFMLETEENDNTWTSDT